MKLFVVNGEGWSCIKKVEKSQDGREAHLVLKTQCEGTASKITRKIKLILLFQTPRTAGKDPNTNFRIT